MPSRSIAFACYHPDCANDPPIQVIVEEPKNQAAARGTKQIEQYCERGHLNIITLPDTWNKRPLVLGDPEVIDEQDGVPILRGEEP